LSVTIDDKIQLFSKMIYTNIEEQSAEKRLKAEESFQQEKQRLMEQVEAKRKAIIEEAEKRAERDRKQIIAKANSRAYHQLLETRQSFINEITELLVQEAKAFTSSEGYRRYLSKCFEKAAAAFSGTDLLRLHFTKTDIEALGQFIGQQAAAAGFGSKFELAEAGVSIIGGFYAEDVKHGMQADYTLRALIEENREYIGNYITRRLDEVQGNGN
jgi:V/A-type H+-transporting ATPase subunit E